MLLNRLREDVHEFYLKLRMLDRILETIEFERAYESAVDFRLLKLGIETLDIGIIKFFILLNRDPGELSLRELRRAARHYNVAFWSRLTKFELIDEVTDAGLNSRIREIARQIDFLSNASKDKTSDANRSHASSGRATISQHVGIYSVSAEAATVASRLRRKSISPGENVGKYETDRSDRTSGTEDTGERTNGPPILLEG